MMMKNIIAAAFTLIVVSSASVFAQHERSINAGANLHIHSSYYSIIDRDAFGFAFGYKDRIPMSKHFGFYSAIDILVDRDDYDLWDRYDEWTKIITSTNNITYFKPYNMTVPVVMGVDYRFGNKKGRGFWLAAGLGLDFAFHSDRHFFNYIGSGDKNEYWYFLNNDRILPSVGLSNELSCGYDFEHIAISLRWLNLGRHAEHHVEYEAEKMNLKEPPVVNLDFVDKITNMSQHQAILLTVGYKF